MFRVSLLSCLGRWALGFLAIGLLEKAASNVGIPISSPLFTPPLAPLPCGSGSIVQLISPHCDWSDVSEASSQRLRKVLSFTLGLTDSAGLLTFLIRNPRTKNLLSLSWKLKPEPLLTLSLNPNLQKAKSRSAEKHYAKAAFLSAEMTY